MKLKQAFLALAGLVVVSMGSLAFASSSVSAVAPDQQAPAPNFEDCKKDFFGLKPWYAYLDGEFKSATAPTASLKDPCSIKCFNFFHQSKPNECGQSDSDIPGVLLAIIDDLLRIAGLIAVAFIIVSAFQYVMSEGKPDEASKAKSTLVNALIGLAIAIVAVAFVGFIGNKLGG